MNLLEKIKSIFHKSNRPKMTLQQREAEKYLSESVDRADFEYREKKLARSRFYYL